MSAPHECPIPTGQSCPHATTLAMLQANISTIMETLKDLRDDMKDVKKTVSVIAVLEQHQGTHKEALDRAFSQLKLIETVVSDHSVKLNRYDVMEKVAYFLWTSLAAGVGSIALKVFSVI